MQLNPVKWLCLIFLVPLALAAQSRGFRMDTVLYGAAYYPEYMPSDRLHKDIEMMQQAGIVRPKLSGEDIGNPLELPDALTTLVLDGLRLPPEMAPGRRKLDGKPGRP